jgi:nucleotide-binding universal stress UspA family protein
MDTCLPAGKRCLFKERKCYGTPKKLHRGKERRDHMIEYPKYKKILFCTDFSENADHAFGYAYGVAKRDDGLLYILHVIPENPNQAFAESFITTEDLERIQESIQEDLETNYTERYEKKMGDQVKFEFVTRSGREDDEIIGFATQEKVDLIVMGTHGKTGIEHVFFGSIAERVIRHSPFPVFVIPSKRRPERA